MGFFFKKSKMFNVRMVITEEKILSNIEKVKKLIDPNEKQHIIKLDEDSYFKDLVESITTYLVDYPKKKNFPLDVYKAAYELVEFATGEFEKNNKRIEDLIEVREQNVRISYLLEDAAITVREKQEGWINKLPEYEGKFSSDIAEALTIVANSGIKTPEEIAMANKIIDTKTENLQTNLYIEIDIERIEDSSKALSYIGIEIAEALKEIPIPFDNDIKDKKKISNNEKKNENNLSNLNNVTNNNLNQTNTEQEIRINPSSSANINDSNTNDQNINDTNNQENNEDDFEQSLKNFINSGDEFMDGTSINDFNQANQEQVTPMMYDPNAFINSYSYGQEMVHNDKQNASNMNQYSEYNSELSETLVFGQVYTPKDITQEFYNNTRYEVKPTLFDKVKNSKFIQGIKKIFNIRITFVDDTKMITDGKDRIQ